MNFNESLNEVIKKYGIEILRNQFLARSLLLDYVKSSFYDKRLVDCFLLIYSRHDLCVIFKFMKLELGRDYLQRKYEEFKNEMKVKEYIDAINPIAKIICSKEYEKEKNKCQNISFIVK